MSELLEKARDYEIKEEKQITEKDRPLFHLSSRVGWMNDPNGFSYYDGKYHLFYQYYPYDTQWGPMHWGHAVSQDLINWTYMPVAIAPDCEFDQVGCFSGSAVELPSGEHLLLYTGVCKEESGNPKSKDVQTQCVAVGDGKNYIKYENNPVLSNENLPEEFSRYDFRDPKMWKEEDGYYCVVGNCTDDKDGQILLFKSADALEWQFEKVLIKNNHRYGKMWECPDFFELDEKHTLIMSPQDMLPVGLEFHNGNGTMYISGNYDEKHNFVEETYGTIDYGIDFYAPQTVLSPDDRRIMIGWMQNWDTLPYKPDFQWFGQMSFPREIRMENGKMIQNPIREIENYYGKKITHKNIKFSKAINLPGIDGRCIDLTIEVEPGENDIYKKFEIRFADDGTYYSSILYDPYESILRLDRKYSGTRRATVHQRRAYVKNQKGKFKIRLILDRYSVEAFVNDGEQALSMTFYTDLKAQGIRFLSDGDIYISTTMYELKHEK